MAAFSFSPQSHPRPRSPLPVFLFVPPSLLLLIPLLFGSLYLCFYHSSLSSPKPTKAFRELIAISSSVLAQKANRPLQLSFSTPRSSSTSPLPRLSKRLRRTDPWFNLLLPTARSRSFSGRAAKFFSGHSCKPRFFMTWISLSELFGNRELFAIESLFKSHPKSCLLIVSNTMDSANGDQLLLPFRRRGFLVSAMWPDFPFLLKRTPAASWFDNLRRGAVHPGVYPLGQNLSNLLRLAVLYKYGGVYLDTDVLVMKSFSGLQNAIGAQSVDPVTGNWSRLNNAVMVFDEMHPLVHEFIQEFALTFDGNKWGHNGPYLVSRVVTRVTGRMGFQFNVLPPEAFYPANWTMIKPLFRRRRGGMDSKWASEKLECIRRRSFAVHLWNRESREMEIGEGSVIGRIMADRCLFCSSSSMAEASSSQLD
ncbi:Uncharacterized protein AXF42_Ash008473 [Apostasia shenzhenica]|uniref:Alpha 1,4-glycosyltransferase domain-containing protein n=1 Tax=Apostasia shenzhenica TaxID=1088818 RepID=A0A2I0AXZ1_9ASPA|nr:Uncharacterized protein AXF42_Ash008473 [Apostasia shenzhenica]